MNEKCLFPRPIQSALKFILIRYNVWWCFHWFMFNFVKFSVYIWAHLWYCVFNDDFVYIKWNSNINAYIAIYFKCILGNSLVYDSETTYFQKKYISLLTYLIERYKCCAFLRPPDKHWLEEYVFSAVYLYNLVKQL